MSRFPLLVVSFSFLLVAHLPGQAVRPQEPSKGGPEQNGFTWTETYEGSGNTDGFVTDSFSRIACARFIALE